MRIWHDEQESHQQYFVDASHMIIIISANNTNRENTKEYIYTIASNQSSMLCHGDVVAGGH